MELSRADPTLSVGRLQTLFLLAALTFLPTLWLQYTGEESVYTLLAYEQWYSGQALSSTVLGEFYGRPPLFNWLIIALAVPIGWPHALVAARCISALATLGSGLLVVATARRMGADRRFAWFAGVVFLSLWEPLFYYGWLAYSDALMGLFSLAAMLAAWLAIRHDRPAWLALAWLMALLGFLTKALTAYVFLGVAILVCVWRYRAWGRLLRPAMLLACLPALLPLMWFQFTATGGGHLAQGMTADIRGKLGFKGWSAWCLHTGGFALHTLINLLPASGLAAYAAWRARPLRGGAFAAAGRADRRVEAGFSRHDALTGAWIAGLNALPYCLAPQSSTRYLMPIYGVAALALAYVLGVDAQRRRWTLRAVAATLLVKAVLALWLFPAYTARVRPDIAAIAQTVAERTAGQPLYVGTTGWVELSVASTLDLTPDTQGRPRPPILRAPAQWSEGWMITAPNSAGGERVVQEFGDHDLALVCRGAGCPSGR